MKNCPLNYLLMCNSLGMIILACRYINKYSRNFASFLVKSGIGKIYASLVIDEFAVSSSYNRSSHRMCSLKKAALKNFALFTGKDLCWSLLLIKFQSISPANFIKKRLKYMYFHINVAKFLRTPILKNTPNSCFCYDVSPVLF